MKIAVVAPSCPLHRDAARALEALAEKRSSRIAIHPQCFASEGHFAGPDSLRLAALREVMADPNVDAIWFARGGYGSNRIAQAAARDLPPAALGKLVMGYSDGGFLLAALHRAGVAVAHGPMPQDLLRPGGEAAAARALDWIERRDPSALEPGLDGPAMAFNMTVLSALAGTALEPDFAGVDLILEDVSEHHYRIDRLMFHLTGQEGIRRAARIRLGRVGEIPANDPDFGSDELAIVQDWCARAQIPFGGRADIGHDADNKVVPFPAR